MRLANGERREWIKPIMFSGGLGSIEDTHVKKGQPETGNVLIIYLNQCRRYIYMHLSMTHHVPLLLCCACQSGMEVVKIGGPVYRIGVGGGAASSVQVRPLNRAD